MLIIDLARSISDLLMLIIDWARSISDLAESISDWTESISCYELLRGVILNPEFQIYLPSHLYSYFIYRDYNQLNSILPVFKQKKT